MRHSVMKYEVIVSDMAWQMLEEHMAFIAIKDREAALKLTQELYDAIKTLDHMPERYPFFDALYLTPNKYHKMYVTKHYLVLYQVRGSVVHVDFVIDCRQDYKWLMYP